MFIGCRVESIRDIIATRKSIKLLLSVILRPSLMCGIILQGDLQ